MSVSTNARATGVTPPYAMTESSDPLAGVDTGAVYTKDVSGRTELFYEDDTGAIIQLTSAGAISSSAIAPFTIESSTSAAVRAGASATTFSVYNTYTAGTPDYERFQIQWSGNVANFGTTKNGTGTARSSAWLIGGSASFAILVGLSYDGAIQVASSAYASTTTTAVTIFGGARTSTSGNVTEVAITSTFQDSGTNSTTVAKALNIAPTINYTGASKTGKVYLLNFAPTLTSQPTGKNAGISFSSAFTSSTFPAMRFCNTADEDTNFEVVQMGWNVLTSNVFSIAPLVGGTGTFRGLSLGYSDSVAEAISISTTPSPIIMGYTAASSSNLSFAILQVGRTNSGTSTSGTRALINATYNLAPTSTSTAILYGVQINPTINFSNGTPGAGYVYGVYIAPVNTALPTGQSAAIAFSSTASALGGERYLNTVDETTNYEHVTQKFTSNVFVFNSAAGGSGTVRSVAWASSGTNRMVMDLNGKFAWTVAAVSSGTTANWAYTASVNTGGAAPYFTLTGAASTGQTASTEINFVNFALNQTVTWATGALALQRCFLIQATTLAFAGASTVTQAATFAISGPPVAGSNATITQNPYALFIGGGDVMLAGSGSALATSAVTGFPWIPSCAGAPTGAPVGPTGAIPMVYDSTNQKIWFRSGGTWRGVVVA